MFISRFLLLCLLSFPLVAGHPFPYKPPRNFSLYMGKNVISHLVSTCNREAQAYFNQGLTLTYAFNHDAAYWSFKRASEIDPNLAMAYWGMALVLGPNINSPVTPDREKTAYAHIQKALELSKNATDNEQHYITALSKRYSNEESPDLKKLDQNYFDAMGNLVKTFPDDLDAATLYAESGMDLRPWQLYDPDMKPAEGTVEIVALLESVLKRDPEHLGANHYYIHAVEASSQPERALMSAERLLRLLPNSGHIIHMPSHIFILVGDYHKAILANLAAAKIDREYIELYGLYGQYPLHYLTHVLFFISRAYALEGRYEDSLRFANELNQLYLPHFKGMETHEFIVTAPLLTKVRFHRWQEVLNEPKPSSDMLVSNVLWHYSRGLAFAALKDVSNAQAEQKEFDAARKNVPADNVYGYNLASTIFNLADLTLKGALAEAQNDIPSAIKFLQEGVAAQHRINYNEPPDWFIPIRETLGSLYLKNQQYKEAEATFRELLNQHPRDGRGLFGLFLSLKNQNRETDAFWIHQEFVKAWQYSSTPLNIDLL